MTKPLSGPYDRLLRRPGPELDALAAGVTSTIIRGSRIIDPIPVWGAETACYYAGGSRGWSPGDFTDEESARHWEQGDFVDLLLVPVGFFKLPNAAWISQLAGELTPWHAEVVERWRQGIEKSIWLTVVRAYSFKAVKPKFTGGRGLNLRVRSLQARNAEPVVSDRKFSAELIEIQSRVERQADKVLPVKGADVAVQTSYGLAEFSRETGYDKDELAGWCNRLRRKRQLLIYGPPGTGKTYLAERMARHVGESAGGCVELVQFHSSYAYEDFVQGIRPKATAGGLNYEMQQGHFLQFCQRARQMGGRPCVMVIDEINRAHLARVFGELLYLLEYRDRSIPLAAGGEAFAIPENVLLIGTMNTADRSIALVDRAIRRRFSSIRLAPNYRLLQGHMRKLGLASAGLIGVVQAINQAVEDEDFALGISFFLVDDLGDALPEIWRGEIEPYLEEVFYDRPAEGRRWRWQELAKGEMAGWPR